MFKNVMVYRIGEGFSPALADVQAALEPMPVSYTHLRAHET